MRSKSSNRKFARAKSLVLEGLVKQKLKQDHKEESLLIKKKRVK